MFWRKKPFDRNATLAAADKARSKGRLRKATSGYRKVLAAHPNDFAVRSKLAQVLAQTRQWEESRKGFNEAASGYLEAGFADKAIATWVVAAHYFPEDVELWERIANEHVQLGRKAEAVKALLDGRARLRKKKQRPLAILLLQQALALDAFHLDATLDLASLLAKEGAKEEAKRLLANLSSWIKGRGRRRIRATQFRLSPGFGSAMNWLLRR